MAIMRSSNNKCQNYPSLAFVSPTANKWVITLNPNRNQLYFIQSTVTEYNS